MFGIQRGKRLRLAVESSQTFRVRRERLGQHLDGDLPAKVGIERAIDLAHSALAKFGGDLVRADARAGLPGGGQASAPGA